MNAIAIKCFVLAFLVFVLTDLLWLGWLAKGLYHEAFSPFLRLVDGKVQTIWWAMLLVYLLLALAVVVFVLPLSQGSILWAGIYGATIGAIIYGIFNFTCLAVFKDYPLLLSFVDSLWGATLCAFSAIVTTYLSQLSMRPIF